MSYVVPPPAQPAIPIRGLTPIFPVRRVYCIGRNYAAHAREMGADPTREPPFFFLKPADAIRVGEPGSVLDIPYPPQTADLHFEVELVVAIGQGGSDIPAAEASQCVYGYAVGLDLTRRDRQQEMKDLRRPWELGKAFDASAPISPIVPVGDAGDMEQAAISLEQNGQLRQQGNTNQMIWPVAEAISYLSTYFRLEPGDLLFTGTPAGVGPAKAGDLLTAHCQGVGELVVRLV